MGLPQLFCCRLFEGQLSRLALFEQQLEWTLEWVLEWVLECAQALE